MVTLPILYLSDGGWLIVFARNGMAMCRLRSCGLREFVRHFWSYASLGVGVCLALLVLCVARRGSSLSHFHVFAFGRFTTRFSLRDAPPRLTVRVPAVSS